MDADFLTLMLVTQKQDNDLGIYLDFLTKAASSGLTSVQLREKHLNKQELIDLGHQIHAVLKPYSIPLIINDHLDICLALDAEGLHLGQGDGDVRYARQVLGPHKIIGLTLDTLEQCETANQLPIDYVGIGPIFPTKNKPNAVQHWGLHHLAQAVSLSKHPIIAIGGIDETNALSIINTGVHGIAAIGAFHETPDIRITLQSLRTIMKESHCA